MPPDAVGDNRSFKDVRRLIEEEISKIKPSALLTKPVLEEDNLRLKLLGKGGKSRSKDVVRRQLKGLD